VGDAGALDQARQLELVGLGADAFEEVTAFAENRGDEMELDFVENTGRQGGRGDADAVDEDIAVARRLLGARDRLADVVVPRQDSRAGCR